MIQDVRVAISIENCVAWVSKVIIIITIMVQNLEGEDYHRFVLDV